MNDEIKFVKELVTPERAKALLNKNTSNRCSRPKIVLQYSRDMSTGRWKSDTGEAIKISHSGRILDGQHRLQAVEHSGTSQYFHICYNVSEDVFDVIDTGKSRNAGDVFKVAGIKNSNTVSGIIPAYNRLKKGLNAEYTDNKSVTGTNQTILQNYFLRPDFWDYVAARSQTLYSAISKLIPPSMIGAIHAYLLDVHEPYAERFMNQLCRGLNIENETINLMRNILIKDKLSLKKMPPQHKMMLILKTWNCYASGRTLKQLKYDQDKEGAVIPLQPFSQQ